MFNIHFNVTVSWARYQGLIPGVTRMRGVSWSLASMRAAAHLVPPIHMPIWREW